MNATEPFLQNQIYLKQNAGLVTLDVLLKYYWRFIEIFW